MTREITILGAGCTGPLLGAMLAQRGAQTWPVLFQFVFIDGLDRLKLGLGDAE